MLMRLIFVGCGLIAGNFLYQAFGSYDWSAALERSYWQTTAIITVAIINAIFDRTGRLSDPRH